MQSYTGCAIFMFLIANCTLTSHIISIRQILSECVGCDQPHTGQCVCLVTIEPACPLWANFTELLYLYPWPLSPMAAIQGTHWLVIDTFGSHSPPKHNNAPGTADKKYVQIIFQLRSIVVHGATEQRTTENVIKNYFPGLWFSVPRVRVEPRNSVNPLMGIVCVCSSVAVCWCRVRKPSVLLNCCYTLVTGHGTWSRLLPPGPLASVGTFLEAPPQYANIFIFYLFY